MHTMTRTPSWWKVSRTIGNEQMEAAGETCQRATNESGAIGWVLLWALGIPLPILLIVYLVLR